MHALRHGVCTLSPAVVYSCPPQAQKRRQQSVACQPEGRKRSKEGRALCCICNKGTDVTPLTTCSRGIVQEALLRHTAAEAVVGDDILVVTERLRGSTPLYKHQRCVDNLKRRLSSNTPSRPVHTPRQSRQPRTKVHCRMCGRTHNKGQVTHRLCERDAISTLLRSARHVIQEGTDQALSDRCHLLLSGIPVDVSAPREDDFAMVTAADVYMHDSCKKKVYKAARTLPIGRGGNTVASAGGSDGCQTSEDEEWEASASACRADANATTQTLGELTDEQVLSRAAGILHGRVKAMVEAGRQEDAHLPNLDWIMSADSLTDKTLPCFLLAVITGVVYAPRAATSQPRDQPCDDKHWRRSLSLSHDILGCAGHTTNAKWDTVALWLRTTVRQGPVIQVLNGLGTCGTDARARRLERHASDVTLQEIDEGVAAVVLENDGVVSFALDNCDVSSGPLDGRSSHWMNVIAVMTSRRVISISPTPLCRMPAWKKPMASSVADIQPLEVITCQHLPRDAAHVYTSSQEGPLFSQDDAGLRQSLLYTLCRSTERPEGFEPTTTKAQLTEAMHPSVTPRSEIIVLPPIDEEPNSVQCGSQAIAAIKRTLSVVGQRAAVACVDGGLWSKMHQQLYNRAHFEDSILLTLGPFHVMKAYLSALGDFVKMTGWGQALIQAQVVGGSSSVDSALSGAAVYRGIHLHAVFTQVVWDSLLSEFLLEHPDSAGMSELRQAAIVLVADTAGSDPDGSSAAAAIDELRSWIATRNSGTTVFWWTYLQHHQRLENYMDAVRGVHLGGLDAYSAALEGLLPLFVATNKSNYRRMIPLQLQLFKLVPTKFPTLLQELNAGIGLAASKTGRPGSLVGLDLIMEWVNRDCKGPCRLATYLHPEARARFLYVLSAMLRLSTEMVTATKTTVGARASRPPRVQTRLLRDIDALSAVLAEHVGPLSAISGPEIQTLFSHAVVPIEVTESILTGTMQAALKAIEADRECLRPGSKSVLFKGLKLVRGDTVFSALKSSTKPTDKVVFLKAQFAALCKFVTMSERLPQPLPLAQLLQYELFKYPPALFRQNGSLRAAKKAELLPFLLPPGGEQPATGAVLLGLCSHDERGLVAADFSMVLRRSLKATNSFGELIEAAVFNVLQTATRTSAGSALLALDDYTYDGSPKAALQEQRGGKLCPVYAKLSYGKAAPRSWTAFLSRWQNKHQVGDALIAWLPDIMKGWLESGGKPITVYVARAGRGFVLPRDRFALEPLPALCGPEFAEADHTLIWGVGVLRSTGAASDVVILADDTDVKLMSAMYAQREASASSMTLLYNKGTAGQHISHVEGILDHCQSVFTADGAACVWAMCIWTGIDATSAIYGISKRRAASRLKDMFSSAARQDASAGAAREAISLLAAGCPGILQHEADIVPEDTLNLFEQLMLWMYLPKKTDACLVDLRRRLFEFKTPDVLPPTRDATLQHLLRCTLQVRLFLAAASSDHNTTLPHPRWLGWSSISGADAQVWRATPLPPGVPTVPPRLRAAATCGCATGCKNGRCGCIKSGMFCSASCGCHAGAICQNVMPESDVMQREGDDTALALGAEEPVSDCGSGIETGSSSEAATESETEGNETASESESES